MNTNPFRFQFGVTNCRKTHNHVNNVQQMPWKLEKTCASYSRNRAFVFWHDKSDPRLRGRWKTGNRLNFLKTSTGNQLNFKKSPRIIDFQSSKQLSDVSIKFSVSAMPTDRLIDPRKKVEAIETSIMALNMTWSITMAQNAMFYMKIRLLKELTAIQITNFIVNQRALPSCLFEMTFHNFVSFSRCLS